MAKFKVGYKVEDSQRGTGEVVHIDSDTSEDYPVGVRIDGIVRCYTLSGKYDLSENVPSLRLTGRPFNVGDMVVIGGEKGTVGRITDLGTIAPVRIDINDNEEIWITTDGRAWPGTPIIAEHDWNEESESETGKNETENHAADAIEYRVRNKGVDISPGFASDWPIDNGIEDVTVSPEEVRHIAEMHGKSLSGQAEIDILKKQHKYTSMALGLTGFKLDNEAAALITETVKKVLELGGEFSLDTACEVEARVNQIYDEANI